MTATDYLDQIDARRQAVGWAPWEVKTEDRDLPAVWHDGEAAYPIGACPDCGYEAAYSPAIADLIAHAPTDLKRLTATLRSAIAIAGQATMPTEGPCDPEDDAYDQGRADTGRAIRTAIETHLGDPT